MPRSIHGLIIALAACGTGPGMAAPALVSVDCTPCCDKSPAPACRLVPACIPLCECSQGDLTDNHFTPGCVR